MKEKNKSEQLQKNQELIDNYDYLKNAASSMDCTGLIPSLPQSEAELDAYNELYQYQSPLVNPENSKK